jgi:hypothetical protein
VAKKPTREQKEYWAWVTSQMCLVCGCDANIHHQIHEKCDPDIEVRQSKNHWQVTPLCKYHHQDQRYGWHGLGSNWKFEEMYGIDLVEEAKRLLDTYHSSR